MIPIFNPQRIAFSMNKRRFKSLQDKSIAMNLRELNQALPDYDQNVRLDPSVEYSLHLPWMGSIRSTPKTPQLIDQQTGEIIKDFPVKLYKILLFKNENDPLTKLEKTMWFSFGEVDLHRMYNTSSSIYFDALTLAQPAFDQKLLKHIITALTILQNQERVVVPRFVLNKVQYQLFLDGVPR